MVNTPGNQILDYTGIQHLISSCALDTLSAAVSNILQCTQRHMKSLEMPSSNALFVFFSTMLESDSMNIIARL